MSQYIKQLQDKDGNDILPITGTNAVFDTNGVDVETKIQLTHTTYTPSSGTLAFTTTATRTYGKATISTNTSLVINLGNANEHYLLVVNSSTSAVTLAVSGSASESIIGETAIEVPASGNVEISILKDNGAYIVTYFTFE